MPETPNLGEAVGKIKAPGHVKEWLPVRMVLRCAKWLGTGIGLLYKGGRNLTKRAWGAAEGMCIEAPGAALEAVARGFGHESQQKRLLPKIGELGRKVAHRTKEALGGVFLEAPAALIDKGLEVVDTTLLKWGGGSGGPTPVPAAGGTPKR